MNSEGADTPGGPPSQAELQNIFSIEKSWEIIVDSVQVKERLQGEHLANWYGVTAGCGLPSSPSCRISPVPPVCVCAFSPVRSVSLHVKVAYPRPESRCQVVPSPPGALALPSCSRSCLAPAPVSGILAFQNYTVCNSLRVVFSINIIPWRPVQMVWSVSSSLRLRLFVVCMSRSLTVHLGRTSRLFLVWAVMNKAAMNVLMQVLCKYKFSFL